MLIYMINLFLMLAGLGIIVPIDLLYLNLNKNLYTPIIDPNENINILCYFYMITHYYFYPNYYIIKTTVENTY